MYGYGAMVKFHACVSSLVTWPLWLPSHDAGSWVRSLIWCQSILWTGYKVEIWDRQSEASQEEDACSFQNLMTGILGPDTGPSSTWGSRGYPIADTPRLACLIVTIGPSLGQCRMLMKQRFGRRQKKMLCISDSQ